MTRTPLQRATEPIAKEREAELTARRKMRSQMRRETGRLPTDKALNERLTNLKGPQ